MPPAKPAATSPSLELTSWLKQEAKETLANHLLAQKKMQGRLSNIEKEKLLHHAARLGAPFVNSMANAQRAAQRMNIPGLEQYLGRLANLWTPGTQAKTPDIEYCQNVHRIRENHLLIGLPTPGTEHLKHWMETLSTCNPVGFLCAQMGQAFVLSWITQFESKDPLYSKPIPQNFELRFERNQIEWKEFDRALQDLGEAWNSLELRRVVHYQFRQFGASWSELLDEADPGIPGLT